MNKIMILVILICTLLPTAYALDCLYDSEPFIDKNPFSYDKIFLLCTLNATNTSYCYTSVNESNTVLQSNPEPIEVEKIGIDNEYFESKGGMVNVYYTNRNLLVHHNYSVTVDCSYGNGTTESFVTSVIPVYKGMEEVAYRAVWTKENMGFFVGLLIMILVMSAFVYVIVVGFK